MKDKGEKLRYGSLKQTIEARANELFKERGGTGTGYDIHSWFRAERDVINELSRIRIDRKFLWKEHETQEYKETNAPAETQITPKN